MTDDAPLQREPDEAVIECIARALVPTGTNSDATYYVGGHISHRTAHPMWTKYLDTARRVAVAIASAPKAEASDRGHFEDHLSALRDANAGAAVTVWKDGSWQAWQTLDAKYAEGDTNWLCTIPFSDAIGDAFDIVRATAIAAVRREATSAGREQCVEALRTAGATLVGRSRAATFYEAADYLAANKPQDITLAVGPAEGEADDNSSLGMAIFALETALAEGKSYEFRIKKALAYLEPIPVPARDPVALLLAEAARLAKSDDLEDQRRARGLQDAAELLGGGK